jgi:ribosomal protein S27AE
MSYGFCPKCGRAGVSRDRSPDGNTRCEAGHSTPSRDWLRMRPLNLSPDRPLHPSPPPDDYDPRRVVIRTADGEKHECDVTFDMIKRENALLAEVALLKEKLVLAMDKVRLAKQACPNCGRANNQNSPQYSELIAAIKRDHSRGRDFTTGRSAPKKRVGP